LRILLLDNEQVTPLARSRFASATPRTTAWSARAHQIEIGRRQHRDRDPSVGEARAKGRDFGGGSSESLAMCPTTTRPPRP